MEYRLLFLVMALVSLRGNVLATDVSSGKLERLNINSSFAPEMRNVDIWIPGDYDSSKNYSVVYMHDGQMLFDSTTTWNKQEWGADEVAARLMEEGKVKSFIIVGIWNRGDYRYSEYFPEKALTYVSKRRRAKIIRKEMMGEPLADKYLKYLVEDVKPYIDAHYSTRRDMGNTFILGSSMGGLISLYAICEYPDVFGGAACISTHSPMTGVNIFRRNDNRVARAFRKYLASTLPDPTKHRIYFDYGTETLDRWYEPYQKKIDKLMEEAGYNDSNWTTLKFEGQNHSERAWNSRLHLPLEFLLK